MPGSTAIRILLCTLIVVGAPAFAGEEASKSVTDLTPNRRTRLSTAEWNVETGGEVTNKVKIRVMRPMHTWVRTSVGLGAVDSPGRQTAHQFLLGPCARPFRR